MGSKSEPALTLLPILAFHGPRPSDAATQGLRCIVLSGDAMRANIERALQAGFDDYWTKSINARQLLHRLGEALAATRECAEGGSV